MVSKVVLRILQRRNMSIDIGGMRKAYLKEKDAFEVKDLVSKEPFKVCQVLHMQKQQFLLNDKYHFLQNKF